MTWTNIDVLKVQEEGVYTDVIMQGWIEIKIKAVINCRLRHRHYAILDSHHFLHTFEVRQAPHNPMF